MNEMKRISFAMLLLSAVLSGVRADAVTIYCSPTGAGTKDGSSPDNACTLSSVESKFTRGATVKLLDGEYGVTTIRFDSDAKKDITIEGNVEHPENVVISGTGHLTYYKVDGDYEVKGITFRVNGGEAVNLYQGTPRITVRNCVFADNTSNSYAVYLNVTGQKAVVEDCVFTNWLSQYGAVAAENNCADGDITVRRCTFTNCSAGGGSAIRKPKLVEDCTFNECHSTGNGGAIYRFAADAAVSNCVFSGCYAASGKYGGAIAVLNNPVRFENCTFSECHAAFGGAIYSDGIAVECRNCLFAGNYADNASSCGGSALRIKAATTLDNCTFVNNTGLSTGVMNSPVYQTSAPTMRNCLFWNNLDRPDGTLRVSNYDSAATYSAADIALSGTGCARMSESPFAGAEDFTLVKNSAGRLCIDKALQLDWMTASSKDLAGRSRVVGPAPDIGCYEVNALGTSISVH